MNISKSLIIAITALTLSINTQAQTKITNRFLIGIWDLQIDITKELEEAEEEARSNDSFIESIVMSTVSGAITGIIDRIDISLDFKEDGEVKVIIDAFGVREVEYTEWSLDNRGRLLIKTTPSFKTDISEYWVRDGETITLKDDDDENKVYLRKRE